MISSLFQFFWPGIKKEDYRTFFVLSLVFMSLVGAYWLMRLLKDTVFFTIAFPEIFGWAPRQGVLFQPIAKTFSVMFVMAVVLVYSKLVDKFKRQQLFLILGGFYTLMFGLFAAFLVVRYFAGNIAIGKTVMSSFGWISYFVIESCGSVVIPIFWSFVNSIMTDKKARAGYPAIVTFGQIGAVIGSSMNLLAPKIGYIWPLFIAATSFLFASVTTFYYFIKTTPKNKLRDRTKPDKLEKEKTGLIQTFFGGLTLLVRRPYLLGVFIISSMYEIAGTIIDYMMKSQANGLPQYATETGYAKFSGYFGMSTCGLALLMVLFGTSRIMKKFGLRVCLLIYPVCTAGALVALFLYYNFGVPSPANLLWATFGVMMIIKGLSFAINNPAKEIMYIPTSKEAKFKTKGWIDMFGARGSKTIGAQIGNSMKHSLTTFMFFGTLISLGITGVWIIAAILVGQKNKRLVENKEIVQ